VTDDFSVEKSRYQKMNQKEVSLLTKSNQLGPQFGFGKFCSYVPATTLLPKTKTELE